MNCKKLYGRVSCRLACLLFPILAALSASAAAVVEETFEVLQTRTGTYRKVTVTKKAKDWIFILHGAGMGNVKVADLPMEIQEKLGYQTAKKESAGGVAAQLKTSLSKIQLNSSLAKLDVPQLEQLTGNWRAAVDGGARKIAADPMLAATVGGTALVFYVFFCYCSMLICRKANTEPGLLVWIPLLQLIPLFRAANMSGMWFLAVPIPLLNIVAQLLWFVNIAKARGKSLWVAFWLAVPITGPFAYLYLAFSSATPIKTRNLVPLALQTA